MNKTLEPNQKNYELAVANPGLRGPLLNSLLIEGIAEFIECIKYHNRRSFQGSILFTAPHWRSEMGCSGYKAKLHAYSPLFSLDKFPKIEDLISAVVDHEGFHAEEFYNAASKLGSRPNPMDDYCDFWYGTLELRAVRNQLKNAKRRGISQTYLEETLRMEQEWIDFLKSRGVTI